jgi:hypothetical protein
MRCLDLYYIGRGEVRREGEWSFFAEENERKRESEKERIRQGTLTIGGNHSEPVHISSVSLFLSFSSSLFV